MLYLQNIVEPTVAEFRSDPTSARRAFLACVVLYHAIDRVPNRSGNLRKDWRDKSPSFLLVDMLANDLKHARSDLRDHPVARPHTLALAGSPALLGNMAFNTTVFNDFGEQEALESVLSAIESALTFVREQFAGGGQAS
jgi:hypothetical protein